MLMAQGSVLDNDFRATPAALKAPESFRADGKVTLLQTQPGPGSPAPSARSEFRATGF